jgi:uncharacterized membrane-anchored protein
VALDLRRTFRAPKVPEVDAWFWFLKLLSTAMGEATSDYFVHRFNPEVAVAVGFVVFVGFLWLQLSAPRYLITTYWLAVVMVAVFGTMAADVLHVGMGIPYTDTSIGFAIGLAVVFLAWWKAEGTLSIHSITTTRRELFYWATVLATFAMGTALGDFTASTLHLGYLTSIVLFAVLICLPALGALGGLNEIATFWTAYVITRPLGASIADYFGFPTSVGGRGWGHGTTALLLTAVIALVLAGLVTRYNRARRRPALTRYARAGTFPTRDSRSRPTVR